MKAKTERKLDELMAKYFPHIGNRFRDLKKKQQDYIEAILAGKDTMVIMPTAGGKSICFQLPALFWDDSVTIVVSPLRALIKEQVEELNRRTDAAVAVGSRSTMDLIYGKDSPDEARFNAIIKGVYRLVYITPEMLINYNFLRVMRRIRDRVKMVAVDEAHCVSAWGYSFRPSYLAIRRFIMTFSRRPVVSAYTATATQFVLKDTVRALGMKTEGEMESVSYDREELTFHVKHIYKLKKDDTPEEASVRRIKEQKVLEIVRKNVKKGYQGIIFCATPGEAESIYGYLASKKEKLGCGISKYYGEGMDNEEKKENLAEFMSKTSLVMAATNAFGMGINMPGIRFVIHYNIPLCIENYCQEVGRAARGEGVTADCYLLYAGRDEKICRTLIGQTPYPDRRGLAYERFDRMAAYTHKVEGKEPTNELLHERIQAYFRDAGKEIADAAEDAAEVFPLYVNRTYIAGEIRRGRYMAGFDGKNALYFRHTESYVNYKLYGGKVEDNAEVSYFDMMIADAVYSLWLNNRPVYAKSIWGILNGDGQVTLKKEKKEMIEESLRKLQTIHIKIEEHPAGKYGMKLEDEEAAFEGAFLPFREREKETEPYVLEKTPPLYLYAEIQGQFHIFTGEQLQVFKMGAEGPAVDARGNPVKLQSTVENTILKHYLLRRIDLLSEPGMEKKVIPGTNAKRKKGVVHRKKRSGVLSNRINYRLEDGSDLLEKLGVLQETGYQYTLMRQRKEIVGAAVPWKGENGIYQYRVTKKGRIEKILDYYVWEKMLAGYESRINDNEVRPGKEMLFTQIVLDNYSREKKQQYAIDEYRKCRGEYLQME